jgi:hypothetical protein
VVLVVVVYLSLGINGRGLPLECEYSSKTGDEFLRILSQEMFSKVAVVVGNEKRRMCVVITSWKRFVMAEKWKGFM